MSKLKRSALKSVVKECLLEILSEGINTQQVTNLQPKSNEAAHQELDETNQIVQTPTMKDAIAGITSDPILASVLNDTAQTTLVEQAGANRQNEIIKLKGSGSVPRGTLDQFQESDGESHWAALAFADKKN
jgi:hypothetical protein